MRAFWSALACVVACMVAASGASATPLVATDGLNLYKLDSATPGSVSAALPVTGLQVSETLFDIDYRPVDSNVFGIGSTSRLYVVNTTTGVATQIGTAGAFTLNGTAFGIDFNPTVDRLRVVSNNEQNIRLNPITGMLAGTDTNLTPLGDVVSAAYTSNVLGATTTTLYDIDSGTGELKMQGGPNGTPSANGGALTNVGSMGLGSALNNAIGFDVAPDGTAYASIVTGGSNKLYTLNLATGAATEVGTIGNGATSFVGLTASTALLQPAGPSAPVTEGTSATVIVSRSGSIAAASSVDYATQAGSAGEGDFTPTSGSLSWAAGDTTAKSFTVPVLADAQIDDGESFDVVFSNPSGTGVAPTKVSVPIADVPPVPVILPPADTRKPKFSLSLRSKKLRTKLKLKVKTDEACKFKVTVKRKKTKVGSKSKSLKKGTTKVTVKLKRKKLKGVRKVTLKASATCTDAAGNKGKASKKLKLKR